MRFIIRVFLEIIISLFDKFEVFVISSPFYFTDITDNTFFSLIFKRLLFQKLGNITIDDSKIFFKLFFEFFNLYNIIFTFSEGPVEPISWFKRGEISESDCQLHCVVTLLSCSFQILFISLNNHIDLRTINTHYRL